MTFRQLSFSAPDAIISMVNENGDELHIMRDADGRGFIFVHDSFTFPCDVIPPEALDALQAWREDTAEQPDSDPCQPPPEEDTTEAEILAGIKQVLESCGFEVDNAHIYRAQ